ncbi:MAG: hypothetical protein LBJ41_07230 [Treponema sp.]|jgi:hypothetical protein|nr:hypothetical protein [Treponema sp.]
METTSFEDIKQILREVAEMQKETRLNFKELFDAQKETDRMFKETDLRHQKLEQSIDKLCKQVGNVDTNIGYAAETYFQTALDKSLTFGNIHFDQVFPNLKTSHKGVSCEFDIVMVNHEAVAIIEVKHRIHPSFPEEMATRKVAQFRTFFPLYKNHALYLGIAGLSMDGIVVENARNFGVGVLKQDGDTIESFDVPLKAY